MRLKYRKSILNIAMRIISLMAKLGLAFYMGSYCSLSDLGMYGLVFAEVMMIGTIMGIHIDYMVSRDLINKPSLTQAHYIRDVGVFYGLNFLLLALFMASGIALHLFRYDIKMVFFIYTIGVLETIANTFYTNMNAMNQQITANLLFFLRSGLWAIIVMAGGIYYPLFRTIDAILTGWICGLVLCLIGTAWSWKHFPWSTVRKTPVNWQWILKNIKKSVFIWIGGLGLIGGGYIDRFITDHYLGRDMVGIITFYSSFTVGVLTLLQSGIFAFASPRMVAFYRSGQTGRFWNEVRHAAWQALVLCLLVSIVISVLMPFFGSLLNRPEFSTNTFTLWLMLIAVTIRSLAEVLFCILFARGQDNAVWKGDLLFIVPVIAGNMVMLPRIGLPAIGYTAILSALILTVWRFWHVRSFHEENISSH